MTLVIDIGSKYIHFIQQKGKNKTKCSKIDLPKESVSNGEIVSVEALKEVIKKEIRKSHYRKNRVTFLVHTSEMVIKEAELPIVKSNEMPLLLEQEVMSMIPDIQSYLVDYKVMESMSENTHKNMITAMPKGVIEGYIKLAKAIGAKKCKIDVCQNSISKLIENQPVLEQQPMILADIGNSMLHLHLFEGQKRVFSRSIFINTEQYKDTLILMDQLKDEEAFMNLDLSVESLQENQILFNLMSPYLSSISGEIQNMLQFQLGRNSKNPVQKVYIYGGMSQMKGLAHYLQSDLLIPVKEIQELGISAQVDKINQYVAGLGEIYPDKGKGINFYQVYKQLEKSNKKLSKITLVGGFILAGQVILGGSLAGYMILSANQNSQLAEEIILPYSQPTMVEKLNLLDRMSKEEEALNQELMQLRQGADEVKGKPKLDQIFWNQLKAQMTESLIFSSISYESGQMNITCEADLEQDLLDFVHQLRQLEDVEEVTYTGYTLGDSIYQFNVQIVWKGGVSS